MSYWHNDMSFIRDDTLVLAFERHPWQQGWTWGTPSPVEYDNFIRSGGVRTMGPAWGTIGAEMTFENAFGYYEARIKFPDARGGTWGAFWLMNRLQGQEAGVQQNTTGFDHTFYGRGGAEIDVVESIAAHNNHGFNAATHFDSWQSGHQGNWPGNADTLDGLNIYDGDWHTFSVEWSPNDYRFFINGFEFARLSDINTNFYMPIGEGGWQGLTGADLLQVNQNPNYIKLSMEAAAWSLLAQGALLEDSGEMLVDWVRVWNGPRPASAYTPPNHSNMPTQRVTLVDVNITGTPHVGSTLTAVTNNKPADQPLLGLPPVFQWQQRADEAAVWTNIEDATDGALVLTDEQAGYYIRVRASHGGLTRISTIVGMVEAPGQPSLSLNIFNNGNSNNQSLAQAGLIRMWTRLDGVNALVPYADMEVTATLPNGQDAMSFVRINRIWNDLDNVNLIDVRKTEDWQYIHFAITRFGETLEVLLINDLYISQVFGLQAFNNGNDNNQSLANAGIIRIWTQINGVNALVPTDNLSVTAVDQDGRNAVRYVRINRIWNAPENVNLIDVTKVGADWETINLTVTLGSQVVELPLINNRFTQEQ